jgi:hypothetical protein
MSQEVVYNVLKELGGKATSAQIRAVIAKRYPTSTFDRYVSNRLRQLQKKDIIKLVTQQGKKKSSVFVWKIVRKFV